MLAYSISAAFIGFVHSLAPGHWLPVVLMAKARRWPLRTAVCGACLVAFGHILLSLLLGLASFWVGVHFLSQFESEIERYAGLVLCAFGIVYGVYAWICHSKCHEHHHAHKVNAKQQRAPFLFLFSLGFSPCVAVLPIFAMAAAEGYLAILGAFVSFAGGVWLALVGATLLASMGLVKFEHPVFERYGDVLTGGGVAVMGILLFFFSH